MSEPDFTAMAREAVAKWMIAHSYATGHGDTLDDLLNGLVTEARFGRSIYDGRLAYETITRLTKERDKAREALTKIDAKLNRFEGGTSWSLVDEAQDIARNALAQITKGGSKMESNGFKQYRRKQIAELRPWKEGDDMTGVSIGDVDKAAGSPKDGDMIARNPVAHNDMWLVAKAYFEANFEPYKG